MSSEEQSRPRVTVGILYPGHSAEDEYPHLEHLLGGDVRFPLVHTRLDSDAHTVEAMGAAGDEEVLSEGVHKLAPHQPGAIMWACTSGSFAYGWEFAEKQAYKLYEAAGVPASSTSFAFVDAAKHIGAQKVAIAATYPHDLARKFTEFLNHADIEVLGLLSGNVTTATAAGHADKEDVLNFVLATHEQYPEADAILVPDTALHSISWLDELEMRVDKPVLTANQVTAWYGIKLAGGNTVRSGLGTLFRTK